MNVSMARGGGACGERRAGIGGGSGPAAELAVSDADERELVRHGPVDAHADGLARRDEGPCEADAVVRDDLLDAAVRNGVRGVGGRQVSELRLAK